MILRICISIYPSFFFPQNRRRGRVETMEKTFHRDARTKRERVVVPAEILLICKLSTGRRASINQPIHFLFASRSTNIYPRPLLSNIYRATLINRRKLRACADNSPHLSLLRRRGTTRFLSLFPPLSIRKFQVTFFPVKRIPRRIYPRILEMNWSNSVSVERERKRKFETWIVYFNLSSVELNFIKLREFF